jgi:hypothetical protein
MDITIGCKNVKNIMFKIYLNNEIKCFNYLELLLGTNEMAYFRLGTFSIRYDFEQTAE